MKCKCDAFKVSHGIGPISKQPFVKLSDGEYERLVLVPEARKIAGDILQACDDAEGAI